MEGINSNLSAELLQRATDNLRRIEKKAFVAMPQGQVLDPNQQIGGMADPNSPQNPGAAAMMGGAEQPPTGPQGVPVDPQTGQPLQDPNAMAQQAQPPAGMDPQTMYMVMVQAMRQVFQEAGFGQGQQGQQAQGKEQGKGQGQKGTKATLDEVNQNLKMLMQALGVTTPDQAQAGGIPAPAQPMQPIQPLGPSQDPNAQGQLAGGAQGFGPQAGAPSGMQSDANAQAQPKMAGSKGLPSATDKLMAAAAMLQRR